MSKLKEYFNQNEYAHLSIEELEIGLENIQFQLETNGTALENMDGFMERLIETRDPVASAEEYAISVEMVPALEAVTEKYNKSGFFKTVWHDWFSTRHRLVQGLVDLLRKKEKTIEAYQRKLESKNTKLLKKINEEGDTKSIEISMVNLDKYWMMYGNNKKHFPDDIVKAAKEDYAFSESLVIDAPKDLITRCKKAADVVMSGDYSSTQKFEDTVMRKIEDTGGVVQTLDKVTSRGTIQLLNRGAVFPKVSNKDHVEVVMRRPSSWEAITTPIEIKVKYGAWQMDAVQGALVMSGMVVGLAFKAVFSTLVQAATPSVTISYKELKDLSDMGSGFLGLAKQATRSQAGYLKEVDGLITKINNKMSDTDAESAGRRELSKLTTYFDNATNFYDKTISRYVDKMLQSAKGINYVLMRA